ncbi:MAG: beta-ketoacyl-ACP synthase II [Deltaproteobacteria bacterium]|nr:beta-ketoacyl-ACP synthase II [Deltaproteobacteria bacterium]
MSKAGKTRVVVTGAGLITPLGSTLADFWDSVLKGRSAAKRLERLNTAGFRTTIAATIEDFVPETFIKPKDIRRMDRFAQLAIGATSMALKQSGLKTDDEIKDKVGVILGSAVAGIISHESAAEELFVRGYRYVNPLTVPLVMFNAGASNICMQFGFTGVSFGIATACSSGTNAIGEAYLRIKSGFADIMAAGGSDAPISPVCFAAWDKLRAMSTCNDTPERACKPFSKNRDGLVMAEGAGMVILESMGHAEARGADIMAEVIGYGATSDAHHITYPNHAQEVRAMRMALEDACIEPSEIDYINAHGTGTFANDKVETETIKEVFGKRAYRVPISSTKSMTGHPLGASGAIELIACMLAMENSAIPPTINYEILDPECDLDYVPNEARNIPVDVAMSNSFGFGGANAILIARKWKD